MEQSHKAILALLKDYSEKLGQESGLSDVELQKQKDTIARFVRFVHSTAHPFDRENAVGHFCGSSWVLDKALKRVVLTHHAKLGKWIQLGGHADNDTDLFRVALKEAQEESGLKHIEGFRDENGLCLPFDFTIHDIPAHKGTPAHLHFDVTYVFVAADDQLVCSDESMDLRWFTFEEAFKACEPGMHRQLRNLQSLVGKHK